ncbi:MAG: hypothetical protein AAGA46_01865 [Cyanobacteria bacterium P01_F01_bin.13]
MNYLTQNSLSPVSQSLLNAWKTRYITKVQNISTNSANFRKYPLEFAASEAGRKRILEKLPDKVIKETSHSAAVRTKSLYLEHEYLQFNDTVDLSKFTLQTIPVLLEYYQQQSPLVIRPSGAATAVSPDVQFGIAEISALANRLGNCFAEFQLQNSVSKDWLIQCFLTSQISLTTTSLLSVLDPVEQAMFSPYCNLLEEYVSIPWWRLCQSAGQYGQFSLQYKLVERMLARISEISLATYSRWSQQFGSYASARGDLGDLKIRRSSLRDFDMFQVYLWLSFLQGDLDVIEKELVIFCVYIFKGIGIPWQMTIAGTRLLLEEILSRLTSDEKAIVADTIDRMMNTFQTAK